MGRHSRCAQGNYMNNDEGPDGDSFRPYGADRIG